VGFFFGILKSIELKLFVYLLFYIVLKNFSLTWRHHQTGKGLQNLSLCLVLRAFVQGGIIVVSHAGTRASVLAVSFEGLPVSFD
jgi:hypothetical protein